MTDLIVKNDITVKKLTEQDVIQEEGIALRLLFEGDEAARNALNEHYNSAISFEVITKKEAKQARELRLKIVKYRTTLEKKCKTEKLGYRRVIRAMDAITKLLLVGIDEKEA